MPDDANNLHRQLGTLQRARWRIGQHDTMRQANRFLGGRKLFGLPRFIAETLARYGIEISADAIGRAIYGLVMLLVGSGIFGSLVTKEQWEKATTLDIFAYSLFFAVVLIAAWYYLGGVLVRHSERHGSASSHNQQAATPIEGSCISLDIIKHVAPRQDDVDEGYVRFCVGGRIWVEGTQSFDDVKANIQVCDPKGWRFAEERFVDGTLNPSSHVEECYPAELRIHVETGRLEYKVEEEWRPLHANEDLSYDLYVTARDTNPASISRTVRAAISVYDGAVLEDENEREASRESIDRWLESTR